MKVEIVIEELVLTGFPPGERHRIGAAIERQLARRLSEQGLPPGLQQNHGAARLDGGSFELRPGSKPAAIGDRIATHVHRALIR